MFSSFICIFIGLLIGRITIKGISLSESAVFIISLIYGALFSSHLSSTVSQKYHKEKIDISTNGLKIIENLGLIFFIGSVGFISGPSFFTNLKKNFKSYLISGLLIILTATLTCFYIGKKSAKDVEEFNAIVVGIFSGALTSTPAFSAAKATADTKYESAVTVGHGIAYLFGVIGVVLYVQLVPKILGANMDIERVLVGGEGYIKRMGTERTEHPDMNSNNNNNINNDLNKNNNKDEKDLKMKLKNNLNKNNDKDKDTNNDNNNNDNIEKKIEYDPKRIPTERIDSSTRIPKSTSINDLDNQGTEHENENENEHEQEQEQEQDNNISENQKEKLPWLILDQYGLCVFSFSVVLGIFIGAIRIPLSKKLLDGTTFSFTTTGGVLITSLILGHYGKICCLSLKVDKNLLEIFRHIGLILFLLGTGISGGAKFIQYFKAVYFLYGLAMTLIPLIIGFIFGKYVLKLSLLNNLGSLCGGMTSTPALGTLIAISGTDQIGSSYAATYPIALISVVLASQFMIILMK